MGTIGDGREGLVTVGYRLVYLLFMCMTIDMVTPDCKGSGRGGYGELVQGREKTGERIVWGKQIAVGNRMRVRK